MNVLHPLSIWLSAVENNWLLACCAIAALLTACFFRRAFQPVYIGGGKSGPSLLQAIKGLLTSLWVLIPAGLAAAVLFACILVHQVDVATNRRIGEDAEAVVSELRVRVQKRLLRRCAELLSKATYPDDPGKLDDLPGWVKAVRNGQQPDIAAVREWSAALSSGNWWAIRSVVESPMSPSDGDNRKRGLELVEEVKRYDPKRVSGEPEERANELKEQQKRLRDAFGNPALLDDEHFEEGLSTLQALYGDPSGGSVAASPFSRADIYDFHSLFSFDDENVRLDPVVVEFLDAPWRNETVDVLHTAIIEAYRQQIPTAAEEHFWASLIDRLGKSYQEPSPRTLAKNLARDINSAYRELENARLRRFVHLALALTLLAPGLGQDEYRPPPPEMYDYPTLNLDEVLTRKLFSSVQEEIAGKIEKRNSGDEPFGLGITYVNLRAIIRGPIQLFTFVVFFWGMLLLLKVFLLDLLPQMSYLVLATRRDEAYDPYDLTWVEIWLCQVGAATDPATRQIVESDSRPHDLFPFLLKRLLLAMQAGRSVDEASSVIDQAASDWKTDHAHEDLFFDFVAWALPSLGFLGTVVGIGQGMALANKVLTPDPDVQAQTISYMTEQLGTAFYTTLVALVCALPFMLFYYLATALKSWQSRTFKRLARSFLSTCVEWRRPTSPSPTRPLPVRRKAAHVAEPPINEGGDLALFLQIVNSISAEVSSAALQDHPFLKMEASGTEVWLGRLLIHGGMFTHDEFKVELRGIWAYSRLWRAIDRLPKCWHKLGRLLYWREIRCVQSILKKYGVRAANDPNIHTLRIDNKAKFSKKIQTLTDEFALCMLRGKDQPIWRRLRRQPSDQSQRPEWLRDLNALLHLSENEESGPLADWVLGAADPGAQSIRLLSLLLRPT
jgi:biopolymer transport protein ExbB/TolQ